MSGPAKRRDHRREAYRRVVNLVNEFLRAPPQRASGDLCFLLTIDLHGRRQHVLRSSSGASRQYGWLVYWRAVGPEVEFAVKLGCWFGRGN
jgi:hypothetical protein